ncbi:MAG: hypothetical protein ACYDCN_08480 [Bacteroidia bacterium]
MKPYTFDFTIEAETEIEVQTKLEALSILASKLKAHELQRLAQVVDKEPANLFLAKKYLKL